MLIRSWYFHITVFYEPRFPRILARRPFVQFFLTSSLCQSHVASLHVDLVRNSLLPATWIYLSPERNVKSKVVLTLKQMRSHYDAVRSGGVTPSILTGSIRWRWVLSFRLRVLYPPIWERDHSSLSVRGWVGLRPGMVTAKKRTGETVYV
jgi:hypothetical protein